MQVGNEAVADLKPSTLFPSLATSTNVQLEVK